MAFGHAIKVPTGEDWTPQKPFPLKVGLNIGSLMITTLKVCQKSCVD